LLVELVASDRVDIGIGLMTLEHPALSVESLGTIEAVCVMSPHDPLARKSVIEAADLEGKPFISLGAEDQSRYRIDAAFEGTKIHRNIVIEAHQSEAACSFASLGAGVAIVEPFSASGFRADELAVRAFRPTVLFELWAMTPINRQRSIISTDFLQFFREQLNTFQFTSTQARKAKRTKSR
jgi:DNA-binding transcriptional LysR family regulator